MKEKTILTIIIAIALGLRLAYVVHIWERPLGESDEKDYERLAWNLASGAGFTDEGGNLTTRRAPFPSGFLAFVYMIFGRSVNAARAAQAILGTLSVFLIYLTGRELLGKREGLISAAIVAIYPSFINFTGLLFAETFLVFALVSSVYFMVKKSGNPCLNYAVSGLFFGVTALTRPSVLALPLFIFFITLITKSEKPKESLKKILIITVGMLIAIAPWTIRNYHVHKRFVLINNQLGYTLICSYFYPESGFGMQNHELIRAVTKDIPAKDANFMLEGSAALTKYTIERVAKEPLRFIKLTPLKFLWFWEPFGGRDYGMGSSYDIIYGVTFLFFLFGLAGSRAVWKELIPFYALIIYFILVTLVFFGCRRYRMQIEPFFIIIASYGISRCMEKRPGRLMAALLIIGIAANMLFYFIAEDLKDISRKTAGAFGYTIFHKDRD